MGLFSWLRRDSGKPRPPWVRPEFLGLAVLAGALVGLAYAGVQSMGGGQGGADVSGAGSAPEQRTESLRIDPADLDPLAAQEKLNEWKSQHPHANVLRLEPVSENGRLVGYDITYEE